MGLARDVIFGQIRSPNAGVSDVSCDRSAHE